MDGTSQPGVRGGGPLIELDGSLLNFGIGLRISAGGSTVKGLAINRFRTGIELSAVGGNTIQANHIGVDPGGTIDLGNRWGILILDCPNNLIGGVTTGARNLISGNDTGIWLDGASATGNLIQGNYIGVDSGGGAALGNGTGLGDFRCAGQHDWRNNS